MYPLFQVTVPTIRREAGGTTPVPIPTSTEYGTEEDTTAVVTRMGSTGLSSEEGPTH